jgi:enoyl-[acyl-carrier protein] reductase I
VNAISAGPIKTASARAVGDFSKILSEFSSKAPLRRNVTADDVAGTAVFLASDLSSAMTGQVLYVDAGYHILGIV